MPTDDDFAPTDFGGEELQYECDSCGLKYIMPETAHDHDFLCPECSADSLVPM